jgi:hypothetical protein
MNFVYTDDLDSISILLVEDEALVAIDVKAIIEMAGGRVLGPAYSLGRIQLDASSPDRLRGPGRKPAQ